jgi:hypothetical protein
LRFRHDVKDPGFRGAPSGLRSIAPPHPHAQGPESGIANWCKLAPSFGRRWMDAIAITALGMLGTALSTLSLLPSEAGH